MKREIVKLFKAALMFLGLNTCIAIGAALLLRTPLFAAQKAFLYRLMELDMLCCLVLLIVFVCLHLRKPLLFGLCFCENVMLIGLATLFMALFLSLGPMTIDRSYTIYLLAEMTDHAEQVYSAEEIKTQFINGYIEGKQEHQKRIDEQVSIGNLQEVDSSYQVTAKGKRLVRLFRLVERFFPVPDKNSIYPNGKESVNQKQ